MTTAGVEWGQRSRPRFCPGCGIRKVASLFVDATAFLCRSCTERLDHLAELREVWS